VYDPQHWGPSQDLNIESMQDWSAFNAKPAWACGISILEAAKRFVDDAESNCNIMNMDHARHPAAFETDTAKQREEEE